MAMTREQNEQLTRTGPGTLMGELFRRYWIPALLARGIAGAGRPAGARAAAGREARRVPRHARAASG